MDDLDANPNHPDAMDVDEHQPIASTTSITKTVKHKTPGNHTTKSPLQPEREPEELEPEKINALFEKYYLHQLATEYADELDALRSADDFTDASLPVLMTALKQGIELFEEREKMGVVSYLHQCQHQHQDLQY